MPYLTTTKNLKLQLSPGLVASYDIQPGNGVGTLEHKETHTHTHTHTHLLTYLLSPDPGTRSAKLNIKSNSKYLNRLEVSTDLHALL